VFVIVFLAFKLADLLAFISLPDPQGLSNPVKDVKRFLQVLLAMRGRDYHPDTRLAYWHSGEAQRHGEQTVIIQAPAELARQLHIPQHNRRNRGLRDPGVKAKLFHFSLEETRIGP